MKTKIYIITQEEIKCSNDKMHQVRFAESIENEFISNVRDEVGKNIFSKVQFYNELAEFYWVWKNHENIDVIGVCQSNNSFTKVQNKAPIDETEIHKLLSEYDIIVPSGKIYNQSVADHYSLFYDMKVLSEVRNVLQMLEPNYILSFDYIMNGRIVYDGNALITSVQNFDSYCSWIFPILFEVEKRLEQNDCKLLKKNIWAFLGVRLLRVWLANHAFRVKEVAYLLC